MAITSWNLVATKKKSKGADVLGANCLIKWKDEPDDDPTEVYIHFGDYDDFDDDEDWIFYFCEDERELKSLMEEGVEDFVVLDYELVKGEK